MIEIYSVSSAQLRSGQGPSAIAVYRAMFSPRGLPLPERIRNSRGGVGGKIKFVCVVAFSGFCSGVEGRRPLIWSSCAVWSLSELVSVGFGPNII